MNQDLNTLYIKPSLRSTNFNEYYFSRKLPLLNELNKSGLKTLNFGIGNPDLQPEIKVLESFIKTIKKEDSNGYQPYNGTIELREAFANWYKTFFKVNLNPTCEILPLLGSKEGIVYTTLAYINPGDKVLVPDPGYITYAAATSLAGGIPVFYNLDPENNWQPDWKQIEKMDLSQVKLMWLNYPNMPTGAKASRHTYEKAIELGKKQNILICNDNPYSFILNDEYQSLLSYPEAMDIAIELNSLSKSHNMAGWRVGMLAGNKEYLKNILKIKSNVDSGMFKAIQAASISALSLNKNWYQNLNNIYVERQIAVKELLNLLNCTYSEVQSGLFMWAKIPKSFKNGEEFSDMLLHDFGIFVTPGIVFGSQGDQYIRISLCVSKTEIQQAINRTQKTLTKSES